MRKLYYEDCHMTRFTAAVTGCEETEKGWLVTLDATAFYPEGGGQACDLGTLNGIRVLDVQERGEDVVHLCEKPLSVGSQAEGIIDWQRRFDLMQQHSGEHILSGLIHAAYGYHNIGFHIGTDVMEVDFSGPIEPEALLELERKANEAIWKDIPIECWIPDPEELKTVTYRTKRELAWPVRIVRIPGYDTCACCGVHVGRTGEVGMIKILSAVKFRGGIRLEMVCGRRAYEYMTAVYEQNRQVSQTFSAKILETGEAARKVNDALSEEKFRSAGLKRQILSAEAEKLSGRENVLHFMEGLDGGDLRFLGDRLAQVCNGVSAVFSGSDETGYSFCLVSQKEDIGPLCKDMLGALSGRGGGKPGFKQGSVRASREAIEGFFRERLG